MRNIPAKFITTAEYEHHLSSLKPGAQLLSMAKSQRIDICIVFGCLEDDREALSDHEFELISHLHEGYLAGEWRPKPGSSAAFFVAMVEEAAGGRPSPSQRDELIAQVMRRCMYMLQTADRKGSFVPKANMDPKRKKFLDDLDKL